jgi:hypothetical protein
MPTAARAVAKAKPNPQNDPRFKRVVDKLNTDSRKLKQHPPASKKAAEPAKAAKPPANEKAAGARVKHVEKIEQAETKKPETSSFLAMLQAEIAKAMPKTLGDTEKFMKGGSSEEMKGSLKGNVAQQKQEATGDLKSTSSQQPSEAGVAATQVTPIAPEPGVPAPQVDATGAMPLPKPDAEVSLQASKAEVTDPKADSLNKKAWQTDSRYSTMLSAKEAVNKQADAGPAQYRSKEAGTLAQTAAKAADAAKKGAVTLLEVKGGSKAKVLSRQEQQKAKEETELNGFTDFVVKTFEETKKSVDKGLADLDTQVNEMFDQGIEAALNTMKSYVEGQLLQYKLKRYLTIPGLGLALWIKDQILSLPDEVNRFYEAGRARFTTAMNALAVRVATLVEAKLAATKNEVKAAQRKIAAAQAKLSPGVKTRAAAVQAEYTSKFAELESSIDEKKQQLAEGLAQKYKEAFDKADESLKEIKDANKSLVDQAKEKIGGVLKALSEFKDRLLGILRKGADTIDLILKDPIQFLSNLIAAIKAGFNQFVGNIWTHLKAGFMKWLFGSLAKAGIEIPTDLTLPSILKLVLGVLGITYERMRAKAVKLIGEKAVGAIEKVVEYISVLVKGGPAALWEKVKEDLSSLKEMVIDAIQDWIVTTIVKKAVAKVVSMFNPAGAIIQAIMMIYDVVTFIVDKAAQIMDFVEAVINSISAIATGAIGGAANWIEKSLGNMVPILIGFLANLLGLGGISEKIKEFIKKVQDKVDKAIDKAIAKIVGVVKKLFGKGGKDKKAEAPADKKARWDQGSAAVQALAKKERRNPSASGLSQGLKAIKTKFEFTELRLVVKAGKAFIDAAMSPMKQIPVDDTEFVTAEDGVTITVPVKSPAVSVGLAPSNDGNMRLFGFDAKGMKIMVYVVSNKAWQTVPSDERVKEMEAEARQWLVNNKKDFETLVNKENDPKKPSAPGIDIAGLGKEPDSSQERLFIGEAKGSFQGESMWFQAPKFTAIQGKPLPKNIAKMRKANEAAVKRIDTALASGNVTVVIFLNKDAFVSASSWEKLKRRVRKDLKAYILEKFPDGADDIKKIMANVIVTYERI